MPLIGVRPFASSLSGTRPMRVLVLAAMGRHIWGVARRSGRQLRMSGTRSSTCRSGRLDPDGDMTHIWRSRPNCDSSPSMLGNPVTLVSMLRPDEPDLFGVATAINPITRRRFCYEFARARHRKDHAKQCSGVDGRHHQQQ